LIVAETILLFIVCVRNIEEHSSDFILQYQLTVTAHSLVLQGKTQLAISSSSSSLNLTLRI
jgi:hypothetical protein